MTESRSSGSALSRLASRLEAMLFGGGWPFRFLRTIGVRPKVQVRSHAISIDHRPAPTPPLTVAYASDFHAGPTTDRSVLLQACDALRAARPDVLLLGGDFVTHHSSEIDWLAPILGEIPAPMGRFAVLGNHDWWCDPAYIVRRLEADGIQVLLNRNVQLQAPFGKVWICGIDDHWCGAPDATAALAGADGIRIVLMHAPSGLLDLGEERFDVALCGHTHGGQVALPGGIPIILPHGRLSRRYARGRFDLGGGRTLLVSVGLGCVVIPLRLFADPEILVCSIRAAS